MKVGYVLDRFPSRHQTFVLNEMLALERLGLEISVFSLGSPLHHSRDRTDLRAQTTYAPAYSSISRYAGAVIHALRDRPTEQLGLATRAAFSGRRSSISGWLKGAAMSAADDSMDVDHLHAHFATGANVAAMSMAATLGVPFSLTTHAVGLFARPSLLGQSLQRAVFHATISNYNRNYVEAKYGAIAHAKTVVVRAAIDPGRFAVESRRTHNPPVVLSVGRLVEKKGHHLLLEALAELLSQGVDFRAVIVGDGPEKSRLEQLVATLDLGDHVLLAGAADSAEVRELYAAADVYAMPCVVAANGDRDGIPVSIMEAMASGLPIVASDISGIPELVDSRSGALVPAGDTHALAERLREMLTDPDKRLQLGAAGAEIVADEFNVDRSAKQLLELFLESQN